MLFEPGRALFMEEVEGYYSWEISRDLTVKAVKAHFSHLKNRIIIFYGQQSNINTYNSTRLYLTTTPLRLNT